MCQFRIEDRCSLFNEDLFARSFRDGQFVGKEYKPLDACSSAPNADNADRIIRERPAF